MQDEDKDGCGAPRNPADRMDGQVSAALTANPRDGGAWAMLGVRLRQSGQLAEAIACHRRALESEPGNSGIWTNLGNALVDAGRFDEGVAAQQEALRLAPRDPRLLFNAVVALRKAGRFAEALQMIERAAAEGMTAHLRWERALTRLQIGDYVHGLDDYEARRDLTGAPLRPASAPLWDGRALGGRRIFVATEQGFGDALLAARHVPWIAAQGGRVLYECHAELRRVLDGLPVERFLPWGTPVPDCDVEAPQMSLPRLSGTTLASIPPPVRLTIPPESRRKAARLLGAREPGSLRVGIVWSGRVTFADNARRAIPLLPFLRFAEVPGVRLYSLQKGEPEAELDRLGPAAGRLVVPLGADLDDFADTAAVLEQLDLVIMTDSAVAHLAGSLGMPVWNMVQHVPYWIYGFTGDRTPWYPSMRLFRQGPDLDWQPVFERVVAALREEVRRRAAA